MFGLLFIPCGCIFTLLGAGAEEPGLTFSGIVSIFFPIIYLVFGFSGTAFLAWVYNLVSSQTGGIEFELEDLGETGKLDSPPTPVE